jgi:signal transduction histidine kinase
MLGADLFERVFPEDGPRLRAAFLSATGEEPVELVADLQTRTRQKRLVDWLCWREAPGGLEPVRYVVVGLDRTEELAVERQALQNARLAAVGALAAGLAHEIRNPLNGASLHLSVLERELARLPGVSSSSSDAVVIVRSELRRLSSLVTDFLEVARPRPLARAEVDLKGVVQSVIAQVQDDARARGVGLTADLPSSPVVARVDAERLKKVLLNLVHNALEAGDGGGKIAVRLRPAVDRLEIEVEDDGPGIPEGGPPIFDAFFTTKRSGTGLGLSIVHRIVADHGGDVTYTSVPKRTVFQVRLPIAPSSAGSGMNA